MSRPTPWPRRLTAVAFVTAGLLALAGAYVLGSHGPTAGAAVSLSAVLPIGLLGLVGWRRTAASDRWEAAVNSYADRQLTARYRKRVW